MKNRSIFITALTYVLWGLLPLYWQLLSHVPSVFTLCCRIVFSLIFTMAAILLTRRMGEFKALLRDRPTVLKMAAASLFITINWGMYIYAVSSGHTLDASLGYYMNPLVVFAMGAIVFKEKLSKLQLSAIFIAAAGVVITLIICGSIPVISLILALSFAAYGTVKKFAHIPPLLSIAIETIISAPFALIAMLAFFGDTISALSVSDTVLLVLAGPVTAIPLILFAIGVNDLDFKTLGFIQYISPTLTMIVGLLGGEALTLEKVIPFAAVMLALIVYSIGLFKKDTSAQSAKKRGCLNSELLPIC